MELTGAAPLTERGSIPAHPLCSELSRRRPNPGHHVNWTCVSGSSRTPELKHFPLTASRLLFYPKRMTWTLCAGVFLPPDCHHFLLKPVFSFNYCSLALVRWHVVCSLALPRGKRGKTESLVSSLPPNSVVVLLLHHRLPLALPADENIYLQICLMLPQNAGMSV